MLLIISALLLQFGSYLSLLGVWLHLWDYNSQFAPRVLLVGFICLILGGGMDL